MAEHELTKTSQRTPFEAYGGQGLWLPVLALVAFGLLFVYSSSSVYSQQKYGDGYLFFRKQLLFLIPATAAGLASALVPLNWIYRNAGILFGVAVSVTALTLIPGVGHEVGGGSRWLAFAGYQVQPGEFLKIITLVFAARIAAMHPQKPLLLWPTGLALAVLLGQPDFGSTLILIAGLTAVIFIMGIPVRLFVLGGALALPVVFGAMIAAPYRMRRLTTFLDPFADPLGAGFQIIQSYVAIASGRLFGKGLGGSQQKLFFLPEAHTDFILAVIAEEMGFAGVLIIAVTYVLLFMVMTIIISRISDPRDRLLGAGLFTMMGSSAIVNMGVVTGMLPTKGLPLPFISSGGSALIASFIAVGLLAQMHRRALDAT